MSDREGVAGSQPLKSPIESKKKGSQSYNSKKEKRNMGRLVTLFVFLRNTCE